MLTRKNVTLVVLGLAIAGAGLAYWRMQALDAEFEAAQAQGRELNLQRDEQRGVTTQKCPKCQSEIPLRAVNAHVVRLICRNTKTSTRYARILYRGAYGSFRWALISRTMSLTDIP